ncbi:hypothetical protein LRAMOSA11005 [Lichtheimia ramosa]|uniref:Uncharacterized protein n=1 Tax=Lichtheimia ramosa TaxID=688394 RepID=A0A077WQJ4_9FUNG|nr:hypothetical protein LRAMOSA11005 [Lichtheimia ramosa]
MSDTPASPVSQEMIHPTALEPIKNKEMNEPKVGAGVSPPPTPPSKDDEDIKKGAQSSSQDFNPLTADTDSVHNDSHAKSIESVEPGASTHEPKPTILHHDKNESTEETTRIQQDKPMPYHIPEATAKNEPSTDEKNQHQDDTIEQAAAPAATATTFDNKPANGNNTNAKEKVHGATKELKRQTSKKKPLFGFLKKTSADKDSKRKSWQFWK